MTLAAGGLAGCDVRHVPPVDVDAGPQAACANADDCTWGEIDHEILSRSDCVCLFGCPSLPQSKTTATRRVQQHQALCDPNKDKNGNPCPVDDCITPPPLMCVQGTCVGPR